MRSYSLAGSDASMRFSFGSGDRSLGILLFDMGGLIDFLVKRE